MFKKRHKPKTQDKFIDIEARLQGDVKFSSPVNLRINSRFEGELETLGLLIIGEKADVKAKIIKGDNIIIVGKVKGDIVSSKRLELLSTAKVIGNIKSQILVVNEGAMFKGHCQLPIEDEKESTKERSKKKK